MVLLPGTRLGVYEIQSALGAGGMGEVYRARDLELGRDVAIKVLHAAVAQDTDRNWETNRLLRSIKCPVLVTVGEKGWLESYRVIELTDQVRARGHELTLKIFRQHETAAAQGHLDNPTLANEFIFDWIASRLRRVRLRQV